MRRSLSARTETETETGDCELTRVRHADQRRGAVGTVDGVILDEQEARARFSAARVARLATADAAGMPHLVPVTFALVGDVAVIAVDHKPKRTHDLKRLQNIRANPRVALLVDRYDDDWEHLWWVRADAVARVIEGTAGRAAPVAKLRDKYQQYQGTPPAGPVIEAAVTRWVGWSFG